MINPHRTATDDQPALDLADPDPHAPLLCLGAGEGGEGRRLAPEVGALLKLGDLAGEQGVPVVAGAAGVLGELESLERLHGECSWGARPFGPRGNPPRPAAA